jgi:hypothetical protein
MRTDKAYVDEKLDAMMVARKVGHAPLYPSEAAHKVGDTPLHPSEAARKVGNALLYPSKAARKVGDAPLYPSEAARKVGEGQYDTIKTIIIQNILLLFIIN